VPRLVRFDLAEIDREDPQDRTLGPERDWHEERLISAVRCSVALHEPGSQSYGRALAQNHGLEYRGWGLRGGFRQPGQVFLGAHLGPRGVRPGWHFIPNADIGFGDHETLFSFNSRRYPITSPSRISARSMRRALRDSWWHFSDVPRYVDDTESKDRLARYGGDLDQAPVMFELTWGSSDAARISSWG